MNVIQNIPWGKVFANFIWILGASLILADFSYHEFISHQKRVSLGSVLKSRSFNRPFQLGLILITIGVSLSIKTPWLAGTFGGAALLLLVFLLRKLKTKKSKI